MGDRAGSIGHTCRSFVAKLSRTKQVQQPGTAREQPGGSTRCAPCKLARLGVGHGGSLAVGVFVIVGYVAGEVTGPSVLLSLVIAAIACLITGYCYAEYTSHYPTRSMPATAYHYVYMLTGEFPALLVGWCQILAYLAISALLGRTISTTFDHLVGNQIKNFTTFALEGIASSDLVPEPDFLAFAVVFAVAVLVSVGGKPASLSNAVFGVVTCVVVMAVVILAGIQLANENLPLSASIFPEGHTGVLSGAAISIFLFSSYDIISTSSKNFGCSPNEIAHALAISSVVNLVFYVVLGMSFCLLVAPYPWTDENPFVTRLFETHWGKGAMYAVGISAILCVGSALFNNMCSMVYSVFLLGNDGLAFRFLGRLVSRLQSPCLSAITFGGLCGALAIVLTERTLLEVTAISLLLKQLTICACTLSHRYQKIKFDVNENINLEDVLKDNQVKNSETGGKNDTALKMKNGRAGHRAKRKASNRGELSKNGGSPAQIDAVQSNLKSVRFRDDTSESSGASDIDETDIDAIVEEYQDRLHVASLRHFENPLNRRTRVRSPTTFTSNMAAAFTILVCIWTAIIAAILTFRVPALQTADPWTITGTVVCMVTSVVSALVVVMQPPREVKPAFMTSLFPLVPYLGISVNICLIFYLCAEAWIVFAVWLGVGLCLYFFYGICHSVEARRYSFRQPDEERILLPSIPEQAMHQEFVNGQLPKRQNIGYEDFHETP